MFRSGPLWLCALVAVAASTSVAHADIWDGNGASPPSNNWSFAPSWADNTTPGNSDTATFNIADTYTVSFSVNNPAAIQALTISNGEVTFASTSTTNRTLSVNSATGGGTQDVSITGASTFFTLGASPSNAVNLIAGDDLSVQNDAVLTAQFDSNITAADFSPFGLNGSITMDGPGATLTLTGAGANNFIGRSGNDGSLFLLNGTTGNSIAGNLGIADSGTANTTGAVTIVAGSTLSLAGNLTLANQNVADQSATIEIYDTNSSLTLSGPTSITVGSKSNGTAAIDIGVVSPDGTLSTGTGLFTINGTGTVTIGNSGNNNAGTLNANGDVLIRGGVLRRNRGTFIVAPAQTMTIQNGGLFDVRGFYNADATFVVTGGGSAWTNTDSLAIGALGTGSLTVSAGGDVSNTRGHVGLAAGSNGAVTVTGAGSTWANSGSLTVGSSGTGTLTIAAGGTVSTPFVGSIGASTGGDGAVTVTGASSAWTIGEELRVGDQGTGTLTIEDSGAVSGGFSVVGLGPDSMGAVTVTGAGSTWNSSSFNVGHQGTASLTIEDGGAVSGAAGAVGNSLGGDGTAIVTGAGSTWTNSGELIVGNQGTGTLTIAAGGTVSNTIGALGVSGSHDGINFGDGTVTVTGAGSTWTNSDDLFIGVEGIGTLTIEQGGAVSNTIGYVGFAVGFGTGDVDGVGTVIVTGAGSTWTTSSLNVGGSLTAPGGTGALHVLSGGLVDVNRNTIVWNNGSIDIQTGGTFNANGDVTIDAGVLTRASGGSFILDAGDTMTIENGGRASFTGSYTTASNAVYNVSGAGSTLEAVTGSISINNAAQVNVSSGGLVSSAANFIIGNGGNGALTVDGSRSSLVSTGPNNSWGRVGSTANVTFSNNATGTLSGNLNLAETSTADTSSVVNVLSGADLRLGGNLTLAIGGGATTSAKINVEGSGSTVTQSGSSTLSIGHASTGGAAINIGTTTSGGTFTTASGLTAINKTGGVIIGSGANTGTFNANGDVTITGGLLRRRLGSAFNLAAGKTMTIQSAGRATFTGGYTTASNAIYNISGAGSVLETLVGGLVVNNGAQVNVTSGGSVSSASFLDIGISADDGALVVSGSSSSASGAAPGANSWALNGHTAKVTFSNSANGSFLGGINLAGSATVGTTAGVDVLSGAGLTVGNLFLATVGGATTSAALTVDGAGSSVTQIGGSALTIGHSSTGSASLVVRNNALLTTGTGLTLVDDTGSIELNTGAVLDALGTIQLSGGSFDFLGGTLHVDNFNGDLVNQGGTLAPGHSAGITNIVGNYRQLAAATLQIELGGTIAGSECDMLEISGESLLAGTLAVSLINSFTPTLGDTFQILTSVGDINGVFDTELLPALAGGLFLDVKYMPKDVVLVVTTGLPGDYNLNGIVDAADYVVWRDNFGATTNLAADGDASGTIDAGDYDVWRAHFGQTAGSGSEARANAAVPEPTTLTIFVAAMVACSLAKVRQCHELRHQ